MRIRSKTLSKQRKNIVLVGEMRDLETISAALTLSETGHLTFGTLHTSDAVHTISRIIGVFPPAEQEQVRSVLADSLRIVICQQLLPNAAGDGRVLASETLVATHAVRSLIRENKLHQIHSIIQTGAALGMSTMNQTLAAHVRLHEIKKEVANAFSPDRNELADELGMA